jgi:DNA-directed RNA polymerase subunit RPC12/RpoP
MRSEAEKVPIPYGCNNCHEEGWIFLESPQQTVFVICPLCRNELAFAYCPECDVFTNFLANSDERRPSTWKCLECKKEYRLNSDFYEHPVRLYFDSDLSDEQKSRIQKQTKRQLAILLIILLLIGALIIVKTRF